MNEQLNQPVVNQALVREPLPPLTQNPIRLRRPYKSKITCLPTDIRTYINQLIYDNVPYADILKKLSDRGYHGFNRSNLSRWVKTGGYKEWLLEKERIETLMRKIGDPSNWIKELEALGLNSCKQLNSLMLSVQLAQAMRDFNPHALTKRLNVEPELFFKLSRIVNAQTLEHQRQQRINLRVKENQPEETSPAKEGCQAVKQLLNLPDCWIPPLPKKPNNPATS
jgi:hypothetical protein